MMHKHHIVPFHEWKETIDPNITRKDKNFNAPDNVVWLTVEQHAECHKLLYELFGRHQDKEAWLCLGGIMTKEEVILKALQRAGKIQGDKNSIEHLKQIAVLGGKAKLGIKHSNESKQLMSIKQKGACNHFFGRKHTPEAREKMRLSWMKRKNGNMDTN